ncbi:hypothetical protein NO995_04275 [Aestuariibaculum sp. M13]|uniref:hypothetical protein n=1 Tax=Aestuariibaculum sp. M13 TaxID=2967132 RepID=UPI002159C775|nr:hypothetical protein [Aestuariibaculum sp. M13]MCR8666883.1 hypothetical protein [Aestuariibaculum sp. M13]
MKKVKILLALVSLGFVACNNDSETTNDNLATSESVNSEIVIEDVESVLDNISIYSDASFGVSSVSKTSTFGKGDHRGESQYFNDCVDVTVELVDETLTTTIVFNGECEDHDGNVITGTITKVRSISDAGKERTITFQDLSINGYLVNGTQTYSYVIANANGNPEFTSTTDISIVTDEGTISKVGTKTVEITAGGDTYSCFDDEKTITGSSTFTDASGAIFTVEITTPLVKPADCRFIASGVKTYTTAEGTITVDYGDGTCDDVATKTDVEGNVTEITLGRKRHH